MLNEALEDRRLLTTSTAFSDTWSQTAEDPSPTAPGVHVAYSATSGYGFIDPNTGPYDSGNMFGGGEADLRGLPAHTMARIVVSGDPYNMYPGGGANGARVTAEGEDGDISLEFGSDYSFTGNSSAATPWFAHSGGDLAVTLQDLNAGYGAWIISWSVEIYTPTISITASDGSISEANGTPQANVVTASRDLPAGWVGAANGDAAIPDLDVVVTLGGTAMRDEDYVLSSDGVDHVTSLKLTTTKTSISLEVKPTKDNKVEGQETITFAAASGGATSGPAKTVTIADDPPVVSISGSGRIDEYTVPSTATFTISRSGGDVSQSLMVHLQSIPTEGDKTATEGMDYRKFYIQNGYAVYVAGNDIEIAGGESSRTVTVESLEDGETETSVAHASSDLREEWIRLSVAADPSYIAQAGTADIAVQDDSKWFYSGWVKDKGPTGTPRNWQLIGVNGEITEDPMDVYHYDYIKEYSTFLVWKVFAGPVLGAFDTNFAPPSFSYTQGNSETWSPGETLTLNGGPVSLGLSWFNFSAGTTTSSSTGVLIDPISASFTEKYMGVALKEGRIVVTKYLRYVNGVLDENYNRPTEYEDIGFTGNVSYATWKATRTWIDPDSTSIGSMTTDENNASTPTDIDQLFANS